MFPNFDSNFCNFLCICNEKFCEAPEIRFYFIINLYFYTLVAVVAKLQHCYATNFTKWLQ